MHHQGTVRGWDRLLNKAQEKTLKNFAVCLKSQNKITFFTKANVSWQLFKLTCLKHPLAPPGTILSLEFKCRNL